jgi:hypothetical protein
MVPKRSRVTTSSGAFSIATVHQLREELSGESEFVFFTALTPAFPAQGGGSLLPDDAPVGVVAAEAQKASRASMAPSQGGQPTRIARSSPRRISR